MRSGSGYVQRTSKVWLVHLRRERVPRRLEFDEPVTADEPRRIVREELGMGCLPHFTHVYVPLDDEEVDNGDGD